MHIDNFIKHDRLGPGRSLIQLLLSGMAVRCTKGERSCKPRDRAAAVQHSSIVTRRESARQTAGPHPGGRGGDAARAAAVDQDLRGGFKGAAQTKNVSCLRAIEGWPNETKIH